ncbi:indolepyruvate ferredoxin oxidoreductase family protein [Hoeflea poritis]|uniref:Indolepyruvate ferredoxin oxidoreductase family protein n=1 Tax=Hoeflea poritis TaxID=2993659 RepID=A0ABT4VR50_9HYPH|nr:indolepyruvate ferredoxin oxidoreductase family protein [Hoeflea poritis]MDA4847191.1 indolepyruvate ferredoxin oxidoreductase family protein [Hoeflea poritis]
MTLHDVSLNDKFDLEKDRIFLTGTQAIVRLLLMQKERDRRAGLNTAGFVSGYRGSPLGGLDQQLFSAGSLLQSNDIVFQPGLNEEMAATACWGTQQPGLYGAGKYDGVFSVWYGKGPGVDRSGDVFRHANLAGSSKHGGVLALMGDDHTAESSTNAHQTEFAFVDTMIPILNPAGVQEIIDYGLYGFALSRFAGTWAALKCVKDNVESTGSVEAGLERLNIVFPEFDMPPGGLNIRPGELDMLGQEARLHDYKRDAVSAFIRANGLNRIVWSGGANARIGIISVGKSYLDVRQSLSDLGIDEAQADRLGLRLMKIAAPWPLGHEDFRAFAEGLEMVIVVEEKRSLIEAQLREELYGTAHQPMVVGKRDETGGWLFPVKGALDPNDISVAVGERILRTIGHSEEIDNRVKRIRQAQAMLSDITDIAVRTPYFCSGCPHNSSTNVPDGSSAAAGIGCHFMAIWMDRDTRGFTQMGGEGAQWVGQQPFTETKHIFQNLGDGTYNHSGILALRFAIASGANMTYKILFNDAVAMTGGQHLDGGLTVDAIARQVRAEGVERIAIVSDEPDKYPSGMEWPARATFHHRSQMDAVQRELREIKGVTVLLYDQTCAAEKRRRRKRGTYPDPDKRVFINEQVCEGCGDCGVQSNCVSVQPVETEFGRKRRIDQSSCNKDFSCVDGFCPSFVTVHGAKIRKAGGTVLTGDPLDGVPQAPVALPADGWACVITGVGGTGVVTIGAILGMAAHLEGKGCGMIDMAGLAQKGGAVLSHVRIAARPDDIAAIRVPAGKADLVLGCDLVVSGSQKVLASVSEGKTLFVANTAEVMPGDFTRDADFSLPIERLKRAIVKAAGDDRTVYFDGTGAATRLFGNAIAANMFMLGMACQRGGLPVSPEAVERAIALNGQAKEMNIAAFRWGRRAAHEPEAVRDLMAATREPDPVRQISRSLDEMVERRTEILTEYQSRRYARRFGNRIDRVRQAEEKVTGKPGALTEAAARNLFKLMAIKDEYEVARLYSNGAFLAELKNQFESWDRLEFHLAPPMLTGRDEGGRPRKRQYGAWMMRLFSVLASLRRLRGTPLDVFSYQAERRNEKRLLREYEALLDEVIDTLSGDRVEAGVALLSYPQKIRGYGHVKDASIGQAEAEREVLKQAFVDGNAKIPQAAE